jgi:hypothetical protein
VLVDEVKEDLVDRFRELATECPDVLVEMVRSVFE